MLGFKFIGGLERRKKGELLKLARYFGRD